MAVKDNHYQFLHLDVSASPHDVQEAVTKLEGKVNMLLTTSPERALELRQRIWRIKEDLLLDDEKREAYDLSLLRGPDVRRHTIEEPEIPAEPAQPEEMSLRALVAEDWQLSMPRPEAVERLRDILRHFHEVMAAFDRDESSALRRYSVAESGDGVADLDAQLARATEAGERARGLLSGSQAEYLLETDADGESRRRAEARERPGGDPAQQLTRAADDAERAAQRMQRIVRGPLFRMQSWQIWLLVVIVSAVALWPAAYAGGQPGALVTGAIIIGAVCLLTVFRMRQMPALEDAYTTVRADVSQAQHWHRAIVEHRAQHAEQDEQNKALYRQAMTEIAESRTAAASELEEEVAAVAGASGLSGAPWDTPAWSEWEPAVSLPEIARFGTLQARAGGRTLAIPALFAFPGPQNLLVRSEGAARARANRSIRSLVLRMLATTPPGRLRLSLIDPHAGATDAASFQSELEGDLGRVASEPEEIEATIADLDAYIRRVAERTLQQTYVSVEQAAEAQGVAEPYQALAISGFPAGFSERALRQLAQIISVGPACGVYTLIAMDDAQTRHPGLSALDLERAFTTVTAEGARFIWQDPDFRECELVLDVPPNPDMLRHIVSTITREVTAADHLERSFGQIAASPEASWPRASTAAGIAVALGRAESKRTCTLELDSESMGHALILGRAGSAAPELVDALITNLCLTYSPDELSLYLVDFDRRLAAYTDTSFPHIQVAAVKCERQFALSVLERLEGEVQDRLSAFRAAGAPDLAAYRSRPDVPMLPRIVVVLSMFAELFAEEDPIAQGATVLLTRLARDGHTVGVHTILVADRLAWVYTQVREIVQRIPVRIAFQCSDADARIALGPNNTGVQMLNSGDEAVFNTWSGDPRRNEELHVLSLLPDEQLLYAERSRALQLERGGHVHPPILFDGSAPPDLAANSPLRARLRGEGDGNDTSLPVWLGEPISLGDPLTVNVHQREGANLLVVAQDATAARGVFEAAAISLLAHNPPSGDTQLHILDFAAAEGSRGSANRWQLLQQLAPDRVTTGGRRELAPLMAELAAEVARRTNDPNAAATPTFLFLYSMQRIRDLRPARAESGAGSNDLTEQFRAVLRDGPSAGIHTVIWSDTLGHLEQVIAPEMLNDIDLRIVFPMDAADSRALIERSTAARLGPGRALFYSEDDDRLETFRPYGLSDETWLTSLNLRRQTQPESLPA